VFIRLHRLVVAAAMRVGRVRYGGERLGTLFESTCTAWRVGSGIPFRKSKGSSLSRQTLRSEGSRRVSGSIGRGYYWAKEYAGQFIARAEGKCKKLHWEFFNRQDEVEIQRNDLIETLEVQLQQEVEKKLLFTVEWELA
jgi:hypothetical protein